MYVCNVRVLCIRQSSHNLCTLRARDVAETVREYRKIVTTVYRVDEKLRF